MSAVATLPRWVVTNNPLQVEAAVRAYLSRPEEPLFFDTETTGLDPHSNKLVMLQVRQPSSKTTLIVDWRPFADEGFGPQLRKVREHLNWAFAFLLTVGHNLKFDAEFLLCNGMELGKVYDTMLAEQLIRGNQGDFKLASVLKKRFGTDMSKLERTWFYEPAPLDERRSEWDAPFPEEELEYGSKDVECLPELYAAQQADIKRLKLQTVADIEMQALPATAAMEVRGIRIDQTLWREFVAQQEVNARAAANEALLVFGPHIMTARISEYDKALKSWEVAKKRLADYEEFLREEWTKDSLGQGWGEYKKTHVALWRAENPVPAKPKLELDPPNIGSQKQLITAMKALGIPVPTKKNDRGETVETTDSDNLERLVVEHPVLRPVLRLRKATKYVDAFGEKLLAFVDEESRIHSDYHQIGADTGRYSCSKPNFQQIPARGEGKALRRAVVAAPGNKLVVADFSNMELRIIADLSGDQTMLDMFASGEDLHSYTAKQMFSLPKEWTKEQTNSTEWRGGQSYRQAAKIVNFLIPYGGSAYALAAQNDIPVDDAQELLDKWFAMFGGVKRWMDRLEQEVTRTWQSTTLSGRIRFYTRPTEPTGSGAEFFERRKQYRKELASIKRQARNSPVQGLGADITKLAIGLFHRDADPEWGGLVALVHDEMVAEGPEETAPLMAEVMAASMDTAMRQFLKRVTLPYPEPTIADHWVHD